MKNFKVAIVQHKVSEPYNNEQNTETAIRYMTEAKNNGADFILFPECFITSYFAPEICSELRPIDEIENDPEFVRWCQNALGDNCECLEKIKDTAKRLNIGVEITGFTKGKKFPQNSAYIIDRDGSVILKYSKVHTCDFDWERYLESGDKFCVCSFDGICIGVMICYDREYPESARELMLQGAQLILVPNDCTDINPHRLNELSVAAMQNMVGVAMANPPGENAGNSCAFHPMIWESSDNMIVLAEPSFDGVIYADFDMDSIIEYREREDLGKFRKTSAYKHLV